MSADFPITIFHNPACGTSRNALEMIREAGYEPTVVEYMKTGWTAAQLRELAATTGRSLRDLIRAKGTPAADLGLLDDGVSEEAILLAMVGEPILVNRPIVVTPRGARLCRPSEVVLELLDRQPQGFIKEDGEVVATGPGEA